MEEHFWYQTQLLERYQMFECTPRAELRCPLVELRRTFRLSRLLSTNTFASRSSLTSAASSGCPAQRVQAEARQFVNWNAVGAIEKMVEQTRAQAFAAAR